MKDDMRIIGIIPDRDLDGRITLKELKLIVFESLQLGPMYQPLVDILQKTGKVENEYTEFKDICNTLQSTAFLTTTPLFVNHRETYCNIRLIITAIIVTRKCYLTTDEIRHGISAYTLISRECKNEFLPLFVEKVIKAFRLVNKTISEVVLKKWYDHCKYHLECHQESRMQIEKEIKQKSMDMPFILPHEFLFLLCNCEDRLKLIQRNHNPELVSQKGNIHRWELFNKESGSHHLSHIHLLGQTAFENQAPHIMITNNLNREAEEKNIRVIGVKQKQPDDQAQKPQQKSPSKSTTRGKQQHNITTSLANEYSELKDELKSVKHSAIEVLGNAKKYLQRFQSPYLEILQNASHATINRINSPSNKTEQLHKSNLFLTQNDFASPNMKQRPLTANNRMKNKEIEERNKTFLHVSKINQNRARQLRPAPYKPPDKASMRSQFSHIFSEKDSLKECQIVGQRLTQLNVSKSRQFQETRGPIVIRANNWITQELEKYDQSQKQLQEMTTKANIISDNTQSTNRFEKMLDYVQTFSKHPQSSSMPRRRPLSSYSYKTISSYKAITNNPLTKSYQQMAIQA